MMGGMGIFEFPAMIEPDGGMGNLIVAMTGALLSMVIAFAATMILYKEDEKKLPSEGEEKIENGTGENKEKLIRKIEIASPLRGQVIQQENMTDAAFATGVLGKGVAVRPEEGKVYAPADGEISVFSRPDMRSESRRQTEWMF